MTPSKSLLVGLVTMVLTVGGCTVGTTDSTSPTGISTTSTAPASSSTEPTPSTSEPPSTTSTTVTTTIEPTTTTEPPAALAGRIIVLDPGHNGMNWAHPDEINQPVDIGTGTKACNTTGASTDDGYPEARFTWEVALLARARLEQLGASVILTREDNDGWGPCITERAAVGNRAGADAVISIHADGGPPDGRGFHVIYPKVVAGLTDDIAEESLRLARALHAAYLRTGMPIADYIGQDGYSERDDLGGLVLSDVPVVFLETGNMRNTVDADLLTDAGFRAGIAEAIAQALKAFFDD